jgi:hypothetical protein
MRRKPDLYLTPVGMLSREVFLKSGSSDSIFDLDCDVA